MVSPKKVSHYLKVLTLVLLSACRHEPLAGEAPAVNEVRTGKKFAVNLPENHSKAQLWHLVDNYDKNKVRNLGTVWHGNEKGIDFNFQALAAGNVTLTFVQRTYADSTSSTSYLLRIIDN